MKITKFEDFDCWKLSLEITKLIYDITSKKPFSSDFNLRDQIRRSIVSVSANIVEGFEKNNNNEFIRFLKIAKGSVGETRNHLYISSAVNYMNDDEFENINRNLLRLSNQIGSFITYLESKRKNGEFINKTR